MSRLEVTRSHCYLCNVEVPLAYINQHQDSSKHRSYSKITKTALERARKQTRQYYIFEEATPALFFCDSCVLLIPDEDKSLHLISTSHKNAASLDRLLNNFSKVYFDDDTEIDVNCEALNGSSHETVEVTEINKHTESSSDGSELMNIDRDAAKLIEDNFESDDDTVNQAAQNKLLVQLDDRNPNIDSVTSFKDFINNLNTDSSEYKIEYIDEKYLKIKTNGGVDLKISHDNFHSLQTLGDVHVQCKLCLKTLRNIIDHWFSTERLDNAILPINKNSWGKDTHAKREDHDTIAETIDYEEHAKNDTIELEKNNEKLKDTASAEVQDVTFNAAHPESEEIYCNVCFIPFDKNDLQLHLNNKKHNSNMKMFYHLSATDFHQKVKCKVCNTIFYKSNCKKHLTGVEHWNLYNALLDTNFLTKRSNNLFCKLCLTCIDIGDELIHINSIGHADSIDLKNKPISEQSFVRSPDNLNNNGGQIWSNFAFSTDVTPFKVNNVYASRTKNVTKNNEISSKTKTDKPINKNQPRVVKCYNLKSNDDESYNTASLNENISKNLIPSSNEDKTENGVSIFGEIVENILEISADGTKFMCRLCHVAIPNSSLNLFDHVIRFHHIDNSVIKEEINKIRPMEGRFFCDVCLVFIEFGREFNHLSNPNHVIKTLSNVLADSARSGRLTSSKGTNNSISTEPSWNSARSVPNPSVRTPGHSHINDFPYLPSKGF